MSDSQPNMNEQLLSLEEKFMYVYTKDNVDGMPERTLFQDRLRQAVAFAKRYKFNVAILSIDLDSFKNDDPSTSTIDDEVLIATIKKIVGALRETDTLSSQGIDELVVILPDVKEEKDAETVAYKIIDLLSTPFKVGDKEIYFEPFIGIALYPEDTQDPYELVVRANVAVSQGKEEGEVVSRIKELNVKEVTA